MFREDLESRENEIIKTLSSLPKAFIMIGGYAASALSAHRFSVDCDIVVSRKDVKEFRNQLKREGYAKKKSSTGLTKSMAGLWRYTQRRSKLEGYRLTFSLAALLRARLAQHGAMTTSEVIPMRQPFLA